ncbi:MAG: SRPBCC family protein [Gaiellaceae bacterium]
MDVDRSAPAVAASETEIAADPETVWEVLTGFESWPSWNPDVRSVTLESAVEEGTVFRWKAGRATLTSTIRQVERPRLIGWTGKTTGIGAVHVWSLEPRDGGTIVRTEESWAGFLVRMLRGPMQKNLQKALDDGLAHLKAEAERRAQGTRG